MDSSSLSEFVKLYDMYMNFLRQKNGKLSEFWMAYVDIVEILFGLLRGSVTGSFINYARYFSAYFLEMSYVEEDYPDVLFPSKQARIHRLLVKRKDSI